MGGRVCDITQLTSGIAAIGPADCAKMDLQRVWSGTACDSGVFTAGGGGGGPGVQKQCTPVANTKLRFRCCASFKKGDEFRDLQLTLGQSILSMQWHWTAYDQSQVQYKPSSSTNIQWITPPGGASVSNDPAMFEIKGLKSGSSYTVGITPLKPDGTLKTIQTITFEVQTSPAS